MRAHEEEFAVRLMCRVLSVSASGYYDWRKRGPSKRAQARVELDVQVKARFTARKSRDGAPRLSRHLHRGRRQVAMSLRRLPRSWTPIIPTAPILDAPILDTHHPDIL